MLHTRASKAYKKEGENWDKKKKKPHSNNLLKVGFHK